MTKRLCASSLLAVVLITAAASTGLAIPSLYGPTGIVSVPNAEIAPVGELQTALTYASRDREVGSMGMYGTAELDEDMWGLNALAGVSREAELWIAYAMTDQDTPTVSIDADVWAIGGKYQITSQANDDFADTAIGASYESWSDLVLGVGSASMGMYGSSSALVDDADVFKAYLAITKDFTPMSDELWQWDSGGTRILGTLGLMYINFSPDSVSSESLTEPYLGLEFIGVGGTSLGLEYRFDDDTLDTDGVFSAVLTYDPATEWSAQIGTTNAGPGGLGLDDQDFFVRVGYDIPLGE